jgi:DNA invertase Pin-like site-specific DNA recombinase
MAGQGKGIRAAAAAKPQVVGPDVGVAAEAADPLVAGRAVVYVRISDDPSGLERGVDRQEADCRALADSLGLVVVEVFRENDVSAFKQRTVTLPSGERVRRVVRPGFRAMLGFLAERRADVMVAYDLDRAVRDPRDLEDLIDARVLHGFQVRSVTGSLRLDTDSDVAMARVLVAMANKSSADTARRVARASRQQAVEGRWHGGGAPFGYQGGGGTLTVVPERAVLAREAAERVVGGESLWAVCQDWNERGLKTPLGAWWRERTIGLFLRNPALKGVRVYRPVQPDGTTAKLPEFEASGNWEPVIDPVLWDQANQVLDARAAKRSRREGAYKRVNPFTGLICCSDCGTPMRKQGPVYICVQPVRGVCSRSVNAAEITALVEDAVLSVFAGVALQPKAPHAAEVGGGGAAGGLLGLIAKDQAALDKLDDDRYDGLIGKAAWARQRARLAGRIAKNQREWDRSRPPAPSGLQVNAATAADEWASRPAAWRHDAAALVLEAVMISAHPKGEPTIVARRREDDDASYKARLRAHRERLLARRVEFVWRA